MSVIINNPKERSRFLKFAVVGVFGAVVDFGVFNLLTQLTLVPAVIASIISFIAAVFSNFTWNRYWTYPDSRSKRISLQLSEFAVISLIGLAIRTPLFAFLEGTFSRIFVTLRVPIFSSMDPVFLAHNLALAIAVIVVMLWNFFVNRYWTYGDVKA
jgi:putative flippase GtrA